MPLAPEYEALLAAAAEAGAPPLSALSPAEGRELYRMMRPANPELAVGEIASIDLPGPGGEIPARVYQPAGQGPFPVLMNFHGGGWVIGDLDTADAICREFCRSANCVVVSVDYRLAPEHPFPAAVEDCYAATLWAGANMGAINGNGKLAVTGESAGANLATVVAQQIRDQGGPKLSYQLLAYPVTDHDLKRGSYIENGEGMMLTTDSMAYFWSHYCPVDADRSNPQASPLLADRLTDLPPALVLTAEFDPLRDEGAAYASALEAAGVPTTYRCADGLIHDFLAMTATFECSRAVFEEACGYLRTAFTEAKA